MVYIRLQLNLPPPPYEPVHFSLDHPSSVRAYLLYGWPLIRTLSYGNFQVNVTIIIHFKYKIDTMGTVSTLQRVIFFIWNKHCMKCVQIRTRKNSVCGHISHSEIIRKKLTWKQKLTRNLGQYSLCYQV